MPDRFPATLDIVPDTPGWGEAHVPSALASVGEWMMWLAVPVGLVFLLAAGIARIRSRRRGQRVSQGPDRANQASRFGTISSGASSPESRIGHTGVSVDQGTGIPPRAVDSVAMGHLASATPPPIAGLGDLAATLQAIAAPPSPPRGWSHGEADRYQAVFDCNPHPMWVVDEQTLRFLAVNDATVYRYGYTREEITALCVGDVCPSEDVDRLTAPQWSVGPDGSMIRWRHRTKAGVLVEAEATTHRCRFDGHHARLIVIGDGTDRRRTAATLREREELLRNIISHIPCGVFWKDRASIYLGCNEQVARDFGLAVPGEVVGLTDYELVPSSEEAEISRACDRQVMETGDPLLNAEETRTGPGGNQITLLTSRVPLCDPTGGPAGVLGVYLDITERKRLEEQYRQAAKMEAVGRLAGGIAHDFNNLLTVIRGNAELLLSVREGFPDEVRMVDEVRMAADRAAGLVRQLLTFSRPQSAKPRVVNLNDVVADLAGILRRLLGAVITVDVEPAAVPIPVLADRGQLEQVVMNLAVNARDAMPDGGQLRLAVGWTYAPVGPAAKFARLSVADTGTGMSEEVKARIFDPFFTTKGPDKGTGLGLAVVHGIVKQAGGEVTVVSATGVGTTFYIDLPWSDHLPTRSGIPATHQAVRKVPVGQSQPVLLVEDEDGIRALARLTLEGRGFAVTEAPDGVAALEILSSDRIFDLVVTDMTMPGVGGQEVAGQATATQPGVRVVYMSGYVPDDSSLAEPAGAVFLPKPFTPAELIRAVETALAPSSAPSGETQGTIQV